MKKTPLASSAMPNGPDKPVMKVDMAQVTKEMRSTLLLLELAMKRFALPGSSKIPLGLLKMLLPLKTVVVVRVAELQNLIEVPAESANQRDPKQSG